MSIHKTLFAALFILASQIVSAQSADEVAIRKVMAGQTESWNKGDLDQFMKSYWNNDSLMFIGKSGITYGYTNTLNNYKKNYNGSDQMGHLTFELLKFQRLSAEYYFVVGKWFLKRKAGDIGGVYTLVFRKVGGQWVIIADHSS